MTAPGTIAPPPDLSTKPKDIVGYCFGFSCPNHHIEHTFDSITMDRYGEQKVCQTCGEISTPAIVKRTAEAAWEELIYTPSIGYGESESLGWRWVNKRSIMSWTKTGDNLTIWTKYEFVKFLNDGIPVSA
jgi:hypothetical protein